MKKYTLLLFLSSFTTIYGQKNDSIGFDNYLSFYCNLNYHDSYKETVVGKQQFILKPSLSFETGAEFHTKVNSYLELGLGLKIGVLPYSDELTFSYDTSLKTIYKPKDFSLSSYGHEYYFTPSVSIKVNLLELNKQILFTELGVNLIFTPLHTESTSTGSIDSLGKNFVHFQYELKNDGNKINASLFLRIGLSKKIKNRIFTYGLVGNYMPGSIKKGSYSFSNIKNPSHGKIELKLNYIGVELSYGIGLKKAVKSPNLTLF